MQLKVTIEIWQKGEWYVATCPELDFVSQGPSPEDARQNLLEVIEIQFEEMDALGTLEDYLLECGYVKDDGVFLPQSEMISFEKSAVQVA
jgi:predicted RNase H-like HicB family nuclease